MADIITRLILKSDAFDANLKRAKGSVNSYQNDILSVAKTAGAGIMKFAGTIGVAVGAYEGFNKLMNSSQTLSDEYNRTIEGLKGAVDNFFYSIGSGDWTPFFNGLDETIRKAREAYNAMDQLGNTKMSYGYFNMKNQAEFQKQITILKDKDSTGAQKEEAQKRLDAVLKDQREIVGQLGRRSTEAVQALVAASTGISAADVSMVSVDRVTRFDVSAMGDAEKKQAEKEYQYFKNAEATLRKKYTKVETVMTGAGMNRSWSTVKTLDYESYNKAMAPMIAKYQDAIVYNGMLVKGSDEWLNKLYGIRSEAFAAEQAYESMTKTANRASQAGGKDSKEDKDEKPLKDTLAWYDAEISRLNKELSEETTMQARATVQAAINELEKKKVNIKMLVEQEAFKIKHGEMKDGELLLPASKAPDIAKIYSDSGTEFAKLESTYSEMIAERQSALSKAIDIEQQTFIQSQIDKLKNTLKELRSMQKESDVTGDIYSAYQNNAGSKKQSSFDLREEIGNMKLPKFESPIKKKDVDLNQQYADSLGDVSNVMGSLSGLFDSNTASVLQWGSSLIGTIAQAIPKILEMSTANEIEATSATKSASANTLAAGSEALKAHAGIPFVGIAMGVAGVAAIIAAMASIPKFANGGIVPGISFAGDKVPAMLNSGEMILNGSQQANLFKMLNSKLYAGLNVERSNITPSVGHLAGLISPSENKVQVEFGKARVIGTDIFLSINNTLKKQGKKPL